MLNVEVKVDHQIHDICAACAATKAFYNMTNYWERKKQIPFWGEIWGSPGPLGSIRFHRRLYSLLI